MKITKTSNEAQNFKMNKEVANKGCYICPFCGQKIEFGGVCTTWYGYKDPSTETLFTELFSKEPKHHYKVDYYHCWKCGAEWESDPYIYA